MIFSLINTLLLINLILLILILISKLHNKKTHIYSYQRLKVSFNLFRQYLDQYYIANFYYTIFVISIYVFLNFIMFFSLRYLILGQFTVILDTNIKYFTNLLFLKEIIKMNIYLFSGYAWIARIKSFITTNHSKKTLEFLAFICYRIASGSYKSDRFTTNFDVWYHDQLNPMENQYAKLFILYYTYLSYIS